MRRKTTLALAIVSASLVGAVLVSSLVGAAHVPLRAHLDVLLSLLGFSHVQVDDRVASLLVSLRWPRIALAAGAGATLAISGAALQGLVRNPLAEPGLVGVSFGAALGAAIAIVAFDTGLHGPLTLIVPVFAFAGGLVATVATIAIARTRGGVSDASLLLAGIAVNAACSAGVGLCTYLASDPQLRNLTFWLLGSYGGATWERTLPIAIGLAIAAAIAIRIARPLDILVLGYAEASDLGVDVKRVRVATIFLVTVAVGATVAVTGPVGFLGLVVPHIVRAFVGPRHGALLLGSAVFGAALSVLADTIARTIVAPSELPLGIVTSAIGAPFFMVLIARRAAGGRLA